MVGGEKETITLVLFPNHPRAGKYPRKTVSATVRTIIIHCAIASALDVLPYGRVESGLRIPSQSSSTDSHPPPPLLRVASKV